MKKLIFIYAIVSIHIAAFAQAPADTLADTAKVWKKGGMVSLSFSQISFTNWAAGGQNSFSGNSFVHLFANYKKNKIAWDNSLDLGYGLFQQGSAAIRKSDDKIDLSSKLGRLAAEKLFYTFLFNFKSQFTSGYNYPNDSVRVSNFLAPAYLLFAIGMDYKRNDHFTLFLSPATVRAVIVTDQTLADAGAYGVDKAITDTSGRIITHGKKMKMEFGGYMKMIYKLEVVKNVFFQTKLELFSNYLKDPQNIVVNWETRITMKVNKFLSANITTTLIYDDAIPVNVYGSDGLVAKTGPRTQFQEVFGLGLSYKF
ncbi:MAG: DUF3078 domain-containing protein [Bacteroidia bacterium]